MTLGNLYKMKDLKSCFQVQQGLDYHDIMAVRTGQNKEIFLEISLNDLAIGNVTSFIPANIQGLDHTKHGPPLVSRL